MLRAFLILFLLKSFTFAEIPAVGSVITTTFGTFKVTETLSPFHSVGASNCNRTPNPWFVGFLGGVTTMTFIHEGYNAYECDKINVKGIAFIPPVCTEQQIYNSETGTCDSPPPPDSDGDGTPDKCDYDHPDFLTLDCNGDGIPNSQQMGPDDDLDGDGTPNKWDADANGDGTADSSDPKSPTYDKSCGGPDTSEGGTSNGPAYPLNNYNFKGAMLPTSCNNLVNTDPNIDSSIVMNDINKECMTRYCYVHVLKSECHYWGSDFIPEGSDWIISTLKNEQQCSSAVDDDRYLDKHWAMPDPTNCPMDKWCYLKVNTKSPDVSPDNNAEKDDETMKHPDLNSTSSDLSPLLNAQNTTNKHLQDLKDKTDVTNASLTDLKDISNKTLNNNIEMKSSLSALKANSDKSLSNDLQSITTLSSINTGIQNASNKISLMSSSITANQDTMKGNLEDIASNTRSIDTRLAGLQDEILKDYGLIEDAEELDSSAITSTLESSLDGFIFNNFFGLANISSGGLPSFQVNVLNKTITIFEPSMLDGLPMTEIRSLIALMFALLGFAHTFRSV